MKLPVRIFNIIVVFLTANLLLFVQGTGWNYLWLIPVALYLQTIFCPSRYTRKMLKKRLQVCAEGCEQLIIFIASSAMSVILYTFTLHRVHDMGVAPWFLSIIICICVEALLFWNGIFRIYVTSAQLGLKQRILGVLFGWIPVLNIIMLFHLIQIAMDEAIFENDKLVTNQLRKKDEICKTRYPLLLVHGVFFRDMKYINYWGRAADEMITHGAVIHYGNHQSAASVMDCGRVLAEKIKEIVETTGCEKLNVIAHSKGGLDVRSAITHFGAGDKVASLTTICTPHHGCCFAEHLLGKFSEKTKAGIARRYNTTLMKLGDLNPDFLSAVNDLTPGACEAFNAMTPDDPRVLYQSYGARMKNSSGGRFPLNYSYRMVSPHDGINDGLVSVESAQWGSSFAVIATKGKRGVSHGDVIDLTRENIKGFDVREFYVQLVSGLKNQGL